MSLIEGHRRPTGARLTGGTGPALAGAPGVLAHRNFRLWVAADVVSTVGSWMQLVAQNWLVLRLTHSPAALGLTLTLQGVPAMAMGMWAGGVVDRLDRRRVLFATQAAFALLAGVLAGAVIGGFASLPLIFTVAVLSGTVGAFNGPAVNGYCTSLVRRDQLASALAITSASSSAGRILGMALAGTVVAVAGAGAAFAVNAASFVIVVLTMLAMSRSQLQPLQRARGEEATVRHAVRCVLASRRLPGLLGVGFVLSAFGRNFQVTMAAMADGPLHGGARGYGALSTVFAVGTLIGAAVATRLPWFSRRVLLAAGAATAVLQLSSGFAPNTVAFAGCMLPAAMGAIVVDTVSSYLLQIAAPEAMRGRVLAVGGLVAAAAGAIGGPVLGGIAQLCGARASLVAGGAVALSAVLLAAWRTEATPVASAGESVRRLWLLRRELRTRPALAA